MPDLKRRDFLAYGSAVWLAVAAPSLASAEPQAPEIENARVRRPWADFEATRTAVKDANTGEMAKAYMLAELGPLPWRFFGDAEGYDVTVNALVDMEDAPESAVGVFALAHAVHPTDPAAHPPRVLLLLCGRVSIAQKIRYHDGIVRFMNEPIGQPYDDFEHRHRAAMRAAYRFPPT